MNYYFHLGASAAKRGQDVDACPYASGGKRLDWLAGYYFIVSMSDCERSD